MGNICILGKGETPNRIRECLYRFVVSDDLVDGPDKYTILVRYGNYGKVRYKPKKVLNGREVLKKLSNKYEELKLLWENCIRTVPFKKEKPKGNVVYFARKFKHTQGKDIKINGEGDFYTKYIPSKTEYRIHFFGDKIITLQEKEYVGEKEEPEIKIRNHENGYRFRVCKKSEIIPAMKKLVIEVREVTGLDFGAIDVLLDVNDNLCVLEINTAPRLTGTALANFVKELYSVYMVDIVENTIEKIAQEISNEDEENEEEDDEEEIEIREDDLYDDNW